MNEPKSLIPRPEAPASDPHLRRARQRATAAEKAKLVWQTVAFAAVVAAITVEVIAIASLHSCHPEPVNALPEPVIPAVQVRTLRVVQEMASPAEEPENDRIEAALLAQAHRINDCTVTHYDACVECCGKADGKTASGVQATPYVTVAVDPNVISLGSDVLVDYDDGEIHYYRADDIGSMVTGNHIDLCVSSHEEAIALGVRAATVYWIEQEEETE